MLEVDRLVAALNAGAVAYVVIGGMAVAAHGFVRATKDPDIVPSPDPANLDRLAGVLGISGQPETQRFQPICLEASMQGPGSGPDTPRSSRGTCCLTGSRAATVQ